MLSRILEVNCKTYCWCNSITLHWRQLMIHRFILQLKISCFSPIHILLWQCFASLWFTSICKFSAQYKQSSSEACVVKAGCCAYICPFNNMASSMSDISLADTKPSNLFNASSLMLKFYSSWWLRENDVSITGFVIWPRTLRWIAHSGRLWKRSGSVCSTIL